jgi:hypothetical protein
VEIELESSELPAQITITDITGRKIFTKKINSSKESLTISDLDSGSYLISFNGKHNRVTKKLIKK